MIVKEINLHIKSHLSSNEISDLVQASICNLFYNV